MDIFTVWGPERTKLLLSYSFKPNRIVLETTGTQWLRRCAHIRCSMELFEMEMHLASATMCLARRHLQRIWSWQLHRGVCDVHAPVSVHAGARQTNKKQPKKQKTKNKQILHWRLCALFYAGACCVKWSRQTVENIFEGGVIYRRRRKTLWSRDPQSAGKQMSHIMRRTTQHNTWRLRDQIHL